MGLSGSEGPARVSVNDFSDVTGSMNRIELQSLMRLDDIVRRCQQPIEVLDCSAKDGGVGLQSVVAWIQRIVKSSAS